LPTVAGPVLPDVARPVLTGDASPSRRRINSRRCRRCPEERRAVSAMPPRPSTFTDSTRKGRGGCPVGAITDALPRPRPVRGEGARPGVATRGEREAECGVPDPLPSLPQRPLLLVRPIADAVSAFGPRPPWPLLSLSERRRGGPESCCCCCRRCRSLLLPAVCSV
jgi:hypothetical protein